MLLDFKLPNKVDLDSTICRRRDNPYAVYILRVVLRIVGRSDESFGQVVRQDQMTSAGKLDIGKGPVKSCRRDTV